MPGAFSALDAGGVAGYMKNITLQARSSGGEHYLDTVGVRGSNPGVPTRYFKGLRFKTVTPSLFFVSTCRPSGPPPPQRSQPAAGTGFVPMQQLAKNPKLPFDKAWIMQGVDWSRYRTIYIAPVNTDHLIRANWWQESIRADQMQQDIQNMAAFMRTQFIKAFQVIPTADCGW